MLVSTGMPSSMKVSRREYEGEDYTCWYFFGHPPLPSDPSWFSILVREDDDLAAFQALQEGVDMPITRSELTLTYSRRWALAPLRLASACRQVNSALTGSKARRRQNIDDVKLNEAWESIENCWEEFESLRQLGLLGILTVEEADRFVDGWKVSIVSKQAVRF